MTSAACFRLPAIGKEQPATIESLCDYCEHDRYVLVGFVLKVSVNFRSVDRIIKLALDALKELGVFNSLTNVVVTPEIQGLAATHSTI